MTLQNYEFFVECFERIINGEKFYTILNKDIKNHPAAIKDKNDAKAIIGSCIRHYLFFKYILCNKYKIDNNRFVLTLMYCLNDHYFTKRYAREDLIDTVKDSMEKNNVEIDLDAVINYFDLKTPYEILKDDFKDNINARYFSLRYNVPEWIINMMSKQYSMNNVIKVIKSFSSKQKYFVKINERTNPNLILDDNEFKIVNDGMYEYIGKGVLRKHHLVNNFSVYTTNFIDAELIKKIKINSLDNIAVFDETKTNLIIDLYNKANKENVFNFFSSDFSKLMKTLEYLRKYKTEKLYYDQCSSTELESRISRKVNTFLLIPKTSNFSSVDSSPEYLLNFDQFSLSDLIENQKKAIRSCAEQVLIGGNLIYLTYTLNKKENDNIVAEFLKERPGFCLKEEKTFFASQNSDAICGYYAIIGREF